MGRKFLPPKIRGKIIFVDSIKRNYVRSNKDMYFVFGDNMLGEPPKNNDYTIRGEPNSIGIPVKWRPEKGFYFNNEDWKNPEVRKAVFSSFKRIKEALKSGKNVAIPRDGSISTRSSSM